MSYYGDESKVRELTLEDALNILERMGLLNMVPAGDTQYFPGAGVEIKNENDHAMRVAIFKGG